MILGATIMKRSNFLLKTFLIIFVTPAIVNTSCVYSASMSNGQYIKTIFNKRIPEISNIRLDNGLGKIINDAYDNNIDVVENLIEQEQSNHSAALINGIYWAKSDEYRESINNLKKLTVSVWENSQDENYYKTVVQHFLKNINTLLSSSKDSTEKYKESWSENEYVKKALGYIMGLTAFRTLYKEKNVILASSTEEYAHTDLFDDVFDIIISDNYYYKILKYFNNDCDALREIIKHDWDCYFNQFEVLAPIISDTESDNTENSITDEESESPHILASQHNALLENRNEQFAENDDGQDIRGLYIIQEKSERNDDSFSNVDETCDEITSGASEYQSVIESIEDYLGKLACMRQACINVYNSSKIGPYNSAKIVPNRKTFEDLYATLLNTVIIKSKNPSQKSLKQMFDILGFSNDILIDKYNEDFINLIFGICLLQKNRSEYGFFLPSFERIFNECQSCQNNGFKIVDRITAAVEAFDLFKVKNDPGSYRRVIENILKTEKDNFIKFRIQDADSYEEVFLAPLFAYISEKLGFAFDQFISLFDEKYNSLCNNLDISRNLSTNELLIVVIMNMINSYNERGDIEAENYESLWSVLGSLKRTKKDYYVSDLYQYIALLIKYFAEFYSNAKFYSNANKRAFDINTFLEGFKYLQKNLVFYINNEDYFRHSDNHFYYHICNKNLNDVSRECLGGNYEEINSNFPDIPCKILCLMKSYELNRTPEERVQYYHSSVDEYEPRDAQGWTSVLSNAEEYIKDHNDLYECGSS